MIKKQKQQEIVIKENMRGGKGEVFIKHHLKPEDLNAPCRLCAELCLKPGVEIGLHEHINEDEVFIIQQGKGIMIDIDKELEVEKGDALLTKGGESHAIRNTGDEDLIITAIIMKYK